MPSILPRRASRLASLLAAFVALAVAPRQAAAVNESEPNDDPSQSNTFTIGSQIFGDLSDGVGPFFDDYFAFSATAGNSYLFVGQNPSGCISSLGPTLKMDIALAITDAGGTPLVTVDNLPSCLTENLNWTAPSTGTFYLNIYEAAGNTPISGVVYRIDTFQTGPTPSPTNSPTPVATASPTASPTPSPTPFQNQGSGRDVPTWDLGNSWDYTRTFTLDLELSDLLSEALGIPVVADAQIDVTDTYRLTVTAIEDRPTTIGGLPVAQRVYVRQRSLGAITGTGVLNLGGTPFATLDLPTTGATLNQGEMLNRVSDLADTHENFRFVATLDATFPTTGTPTIDLATFDIELNLDHDAPLEIADYPYDLSGEQWINTPTRRIFGSLNADFPTLGSGAPGSWNIPGFGVLAAPGDAGIALVRSESYQKSNFYQGPDGARQGYTPSYHSSNGIPPPNAENYWYAPGAEELVERQLPPIMLTDAGDSITAVVRNLRTVVDPGSASVAPEAIGSITYVPYRPASGAQFNVYGIVSPTPPMGTTVTATILDTGVSVNGTTNGAGAFVIFNLTAPPADDSSPASEDGGSFGIELTVAGFPYRKVASVQLDGAGITPAIVWDSYE